MDILNFQEPQTILLNAERLQQNDDLKRESSGIHDDYCSVNSFDSPISDISSTDNSYTPKSVDGTITKKLIIHGTSAAHSIAIKTVITLSKVQENNGNCSTKIKSPTGKAENPEEKIPNPGTESLSGVDNGSEKPKKIYQMNGNQLGNNSNDLCAVLEKTIKSREANVLSRIEKLHKKIGEFKRQMDSIKMKSDGKCDGKNSAYLIESERKRPHRTDSYRKSSTSKYLQKSPVAKVLADIPEEMDEMQNFNTYKKPIFHLNLPNGRREIEKKHLKSPISSNLCNKCNPLKNSIRCIPFAALPYNQSSDRKTIICFCYCAYTKGIGGVTYHTLCQCCGPSTNY